MIVDFNSEVSEFYYKKSLESFAIVKDYLDIELVQCITPDTLDPSLPYLKHPHPRTPSEQSCQMSHYNLVKKSINSNERFIIMEHDAYLYPDKDEVFLQMLEEIEKNPVWNCGIAMECYSVDSKFAKIYCDFIDNVDHESRFGGTMEVCLRTYDIYSSAWYNKKSVLWPADGYDNKSCYSDSLKSCIKREGIIVDAPVSQMFSKKHENTVVHERVNVKVNNSKHYIARNMVRV